MDILIVIILVIATICALVIVPTCLYFCFTRFYCKQRTDADHFVSPTDPSVLNQQLKDPNSQHLGPGSLFYDQHIKQDGCQFPIQHTFPRRLQDASVYTIQDGGRHSIQDGGQNFQRPDPVPFSYRDILIRDEGHQRFQDRSPYTIQDGVHYSIESERSYKQRDGGSRSIQDGRAKKSQNERPRPYSLPKTHDGVIRKIAVPETKITIEERAGIEEYKIKCDRKLAEYREIQAELIAQSYSGPKCPLLICVDARPSHIGGYCINFDTKICYAYTFPTDVLPWDLHDKSRKGDAAEFEMKNLMFALLLWEDQIKDTGKVQIHTDNSAIKYSRNNTYGFRVSDFIRHLRVCEHVKTNKNQDVHINGELNPKAFAQYILPADDLSRWRVKECQDFLMKIYQIYKFKMSHVPKQLISANSKTWHVPTVHYDEYINKVKERLKEWRRNPCLKCGFMVGSSESLYPGVEE